MDDFTKEDILGDGDMIVSKDDLLKRKRCKLYLGVKLIAEFSDRNPVVLVPFRELEEAARGTLTPEIISYLKAWLLLGKHFRVEVSEESRIFRIS